MKSFIIKRSNVELDDKKSNSGYYPLAKVQFLSNEDNIDKKDYSLKNIDTNCMLFIFNENFDEEVWEKPVMSIKTNQNIEGRIVT